MRTSACCRIMSERYVIGAVLAVMLLALGVAMWVYGSAGGQQPAQTKLVIESSGRLHRFMVEVADADASRDRGLMFREGLDARAGLLIDYGEPRVGVALWMKDTPLPLDIIFIAPDATILRIEHNAEPRSEVLIPAGGVVRAVLEIGGGVAADLGIAPGDRIRHAAFDHGTSGNRVVP